MTTAAARLEARYRSHLRRCAPELVQHAAAQSYDRTVRGLLVALRELREMRLDAADAILAEGEALTDWECIAEARRGR